ncbi:MAG: hypothetical protein H7126_01340 [Candidatus Parcubacteria bacterium]|uniref:hypothetical protein n=1 Tax=Phormidesmis priestleyi TaxID=268141 RepID=UPI00083B629C|nr:hypothetical protein [Phormidesmis priestleyi]MBC7822521.1 hypothetical protein [Leptolyngbyaceae cyanobacterium LF-bin-113]
MRKFQNAGEVEHDASDKVIKGNLQMTPIDPHDFYQPSLPLSFADLREPKVQVGRTLRLPITYADVGFCDSTQPKSERSHWFISDRNEVFRQSQFCLLLQ